VPAPRISAVLAVIAAFLGVGAVPIAAGPSTGRPAACHDAPRGAGVDALSFADATRAFDLSGSLGGWYGHAAALGDVDGDGWTDVFFGGFADKTAGRHVRTPDRLLRGGPDGLRLDRSFRVAPGRTAGAAFADLDRDGDLDLVLSRNYRDRAGGRGASIILRNRRGRFVHASTLDRHRGGRSIGVLDYDGDGLLDLFLVEDRFSGGSSALFHNDGGFRFVDRTQAAGLPTDVDGFGVASVDLTNDAWPDLFVADSNRLFVNNRDGSFREATSEVFAIERFGAEDDAAGVATGDLNRDGRIDLVVGQHYNSTVDFGRRVPVRLYLNTGTEVDGSPRFEDHTDDAGLTPLPTKAPYVEIADLDRDGWPDILTTASTERGTRPATFRNLGVGDDGQLRFRSPTGLGSKRYWIAGGTLDADHDGDLDLFLVDYDTRRTSRLLRNRLYDVAAATSCT
jgi:hypothetical protein